MPLHDPCVIAYLLKPDLFEGRHVNVSIETGSELTIGMTVVDYWGVTGKVKLRFRILRNGSVEGLEVLLSSDRAALDQAAVASIVMSNPLPPLPPEFPRDEVGVTFAYYYNLRMGAGE